MPPTQELHSLVIVDDVPEIREILGFLLEESGWFRVTGHAATAAGAIEVSARVRPEIVLLDIDLPDRSGWEIIPELRAAAPGAKVVVISGTIDDLPFRARGTDVAGADAVIDKGTPNHLLIKQLLAVLGPAEPSGRARPSGYEGEDGAARFGAGDPQAWLSAAIAGSNDAVIGLDLDGVIQYWSPAAERLYGHAATDIVGRSKRALVPGDRPDEIDELFERVRAGEVVTNHETVRVHRDGSRIDVIVNLVPVTEPDGSVTGVCSITRNVTARRQTEAALARAVTQLERRNRELLRSNEELDGFAAVASHDLAQPLQVAYGFLDMLRADFGPSIPDPGRTWLDNSLSSLERMRGLVRDILRWARTGSGEPAQDPVPVERVVEAAAAATRAAAEERDAVVDIDGDLPVVVGDAAQLTLVFQNLIANAIKFVPPERRPEVHVTARAGTEDDVVIVVSDNGIGIPSEQRDAVFEMFQRSAAARTFEGTGIGLAIVRKIVRRHGGEVWAEATETGGTAMCVRLPCSVRP